MVTIASGIFIKGVNVSGMTKEEATKAITNYLEENTFYKTDCNRTQRRIRAILTKGLHLRVFGIKEPV